MKILSMKIMMEVGMGFLLLAATVGCSHSNNQATLIPSPTLKILSPTDANTPTTTLSPTFTVKPPPSITPTPTAIPTIMPTPVPPSPTWTPLPTLPPAEAELLVGDLLTQENKNCHLPCWWTFVPGKTPWIEAQSWLQQFAKVRLSEAPKLGFSVGSASFLVPSNIKPSHHLQHYYIVRDGIIDAIEVDPGKVDQYRLSNILQTYGQPDEVWISTYQTSYKGFLPFLVVLFYPSQGILVGTGPGRSSLSSSGDVVGCQNDTPSNLGLWSPDHKMTFDEAAKLFRYDFMEVLPLKEATGMDEKTFYETFKKPNSPVCIRTPANLWPEQ